jgi:hypothetical protein
MSLKNGEKLIGRYFIVRAEASEQLNKMASMWGKSKIDCLRYIIDGNFKLNQHETTDEIRKGKLVEINKQHKIKLVEILSRMVNNIAKQVL